MSVISEQKESPEKRIDVSAEDDQSLQDLNYQYCIDAIDYDFDESNGNMVPKCLVRSVESTPTEDYQLVTE